MTKATALVLMILAVVVACGGSSDDEGSLLKGVPAADIDGSTNSTKLEAAPGDANPGIDAETAEEKALAGHSGRVLETVLVYYTDLVREPPTPVLAWAVNYDRSGTAPFPPLGCGNNCPSPYELIYQFVLIDALSGEFITSANASGPVSTP